MRTFYRPLALACAFALACMLGACSSGAASSSASSAAAEPSAAASASAAAASSAAEASEAQASAESQAVALAPGEYTVAVKTDSSMFHVNEADHGTGVLTVSDDGMSVHIHLVSKKIVKLYLGTAEQAEADEDGALLPTTDEVTYDDGMTEEVYGFDVPVPALDQEFDVAILGEKGTWYSHTVTVSSPEDN